MLLVCLCVLVGLCWSVCAFVEMVGSVSASVVCPSKHDLKHVLCTYLVLSLRLSSSLLSIAFECFVVGWNNKVIMTATSL